MNEKAAQTMILLAVLALPAVAQDEPATMARPESFDDRASYSIGVNMGMSLAAQAAPAFAVDMEYLFQGIRDAMGETGTLMEEPEMASTFQELQAVLKAKQEEVNAKQQEVRREAGETNKQEGAAFLEENGRRAEVTTLASGLQYEVLEDGSGEKPSASDRVSVHYEGQLIDGQVFDSSIKRGAPATFAVGGVISGWTEALQLMSVGSKWKLFIPSDLAYGERGSQSIGPNATLIFDVELLGIEGQ
ncbi:MAG: FKBP-type peptidyl-prolyl cis-trans isomerase [Acidobacteriota bacterium]|nr:FKBP-type peptidyl-prolyl cis-trans isomerase [Acidobacteriota bacterium]